MPWNFDDFWWLVDLLLARDLSLTFSDHVVCHSRPGRSEQIDDVI